jgi:preprotein translocase subunit SecD
MSFLLAGCGASDVASPSGSSGGARWDLQLRPVLSVEPWGNATCPAGESEAASSSPVTACSADGTELYTLGPAGVSGEQIATATVEDSAVAGTAEIRVSLNEAGTAALSTMTAELAGKAAPQSQLAIYSQGQVQSAPAVMEPIITGSVVIAGDFSREQAQRILDGIAVG